MKPVLLALLTNFCFFLYQVQAPNFSRPYWKPQWECFCQVHRASSWALNELSIKYQSEKLCCSCFTFPISCLIGSSPAFKWSTWGTNPYRWGSVRVLLFGMGSPSISYQCLLWWNASKHALMLLDAMRFSVEIPALIYLCSVWYPKWTWIQ